MKIKGVHWICWLFGHRSLLTTNDWDSAHYLACTRCGKWKVMFQ